MGERSGKVARGCGLVAGAVLVAVVAFVGYVLYQLKDLDGHPPPDVAKVAGSAPVVAADQLATSRMDADLAEVAGAGAQVGAGSGSGSGAALGPSAVLDQCQSQRGGMWVEVWSPVACTRNVTAYFAFDGDLDKQLQGWSEALAAKGWSGSDRPVSASGHLCKNPDAKDSVCLQFDWTERPRTKVPDFSVLDPSPQTVVRQRRDVDPVRAESAEFAGSRYVVIVRIAAGYY